MREPYLTVSQLAQATGRSTDSIRNALDHIAPSKIKRADAGRIRITARLSDVQYVFDNLLADRGWNSSPSAATPGGEVGRTR